MLSAASLLLLSVGPGALHFLGDPGCPDQAAVEAQLRLIDPGALASPARHLVLLEPQATGLQMRLFEEGGRLLESRFLAGSKGCEDWAKIAAALLATWEADLAAPQLPLSGLPTEVPPPPLPQAAVQAVAPQARSGEPRAARWQAEIGLGPMGALAGDSSLALGAEILLGLAPGGRPYGGQLTLTGTGARSFPVGDGTARWQRFAVGLGGNGTFGSGHLKLELGAEFLAGLLIAGGRGFLVTHDNSVFDPGIALSTRLRWEFTRHWLAWLQLGASYWLRSEEVQILAGPMPVSTGHIPQIDLFAIIGISLTGDL